MLMAIFDPEVLNQFNGLWENYSEFKKENPEALSVVMWVFGFVLWGGVLVFRSSRQPIVWGEFGKLLLQALQQATNNWKWQNSKKTAIACEANNQKIMCDSCGDFTVNDRSITEYLSRKEKKELKKLKKNIILALQAKDKEDEERREEAQKQKLLEQLAKAQPVHKIELIKEERKESAKEVSMPMINGMPAQVVNKPVVLPPTHYTISEIPAHVKPVVPVVPPTPVMTPKKDEDLNNVEKTILNELMASPTIWRWGTGKDGKPTGNSIRTTVVLYNFKTNTFYVAGKPVKVSLATSTIFSRLANNIIGDLKVKQPLPLSI
jgi:hypothetical protein